MAIPIMAQVGDARQGNIPVGIDAVADPSMFNGPVYVSADAPLNAFGGSGKELAIDGRPVGMIDGADAESEASGDDNESSALLAGMVGELGKLPGDLQLMHPVKTRKISSPYGWRANPTGPGNQIHIGQDYPIACGSPVYASEAGTVTVSSWAGHSGMRVTIDHGSNVQTGYSHNSKLIAKVGQRVEQGELIALAGTTGNSTGCHVHFEVIIDGRWHDPRNYLPTIPGQRQAMINSQRLTVNAGTAPKGNGSQTPDRAPSGPDPDVIVPEDDTPVIPRPKPTPSETKRPSPSESESPSGSQSPVGSQSPDGSESPDSSKSPDESTSPSESQSPEGSTSPDESSPTAPAPASPAPTEETPVDETPTKSKDEAVTDSPTNPAPETEADSSKSTSTGSETPNASTSSAPAPSTTGTTQVAPSGSSSQSATNE
ncbi:peptidoglycan DD-metalloendopeptidase family protein [Glutamicibacter sp. FR1]|uniref:M23 family metallopeptidase n=1 Tax=Glutamicibacter sp. FR1 TaxID=3393744 RepID=UPI0039B07FA5